jgi:hypothetical protein
MPHWAIAPSCNLAISRSCVACKKDPARQHFQQEPRAGRKKRSNTAYAPRAHRIVFPADASKYGQQALWPALVFAWAERARQPELIENHRRSPVALYDTKKGKGERPTHRNECGAGLIRAAPQ